MTTTHTLTPEHCPLCEALWARMNKPRETREQIYPEGGWIPLVRSSIQDVFEIMLGCKVEISATTPPENLQAITAVIGLAGYVTGTLNLRCSAATARAIAGIMLGFAVEDGPAGEEIVYDALGEICNMVAGSFKGRIPGVEEACSLSTPTIVTGSDYQVHTIANGERVMAAFSFNGSPVWVSLELHQ